MYQVVPGGAGGTITDVIPKQKHSKVTRPVVGAGVIGLVLVIAAVTAWCYYIGSLRKAELLKTQLLDLNKDGYIIRNQGGSIVFRMDFRLALLDYNVYGYETHLEYTCKYVQRSKVCFIVIF